MMQERLSSEVLALLACPVCYGPLSVVNNEVLCGQCERRYPIEDEIPVLLADRALSSEAADGYTDK
jgi:hypothetical protein